MIPRRQLSTLFPTRRSSDLGAIELVRAGAPDAERFAAARAVVVARPAQLERPGEPEIEHRVDDGARQRIDRDRKSTRLNSSHLGISYAVFCLKKKKTT